MGMAEPLDLNASGSEIGTSLHLDGLTPPPLMTGSKLNLLALTFIPRERWFSLILKGKWPLPFPLIDVGA